MAATEPELVWPLPHVVRGLGILGLWVPPPGRRCRHLLVLAFVMVSHVCLLLTVNASIIMDTPSDLPRLSFIAYNCLTYIGLASKMFSFSLDGHRLTELLRLLAASRQRFPDTQGRRARHHVTATRLHRFLQVTYRMNSAYWSVAPIIRIVAAGSASRASRDLVIPLWLPLDTRASPAYETLYCLQLAFGWTVSETTVLVDGSLIALMLQVAAELAVLNDRLAATAADIGEGIPGTTRVQVSPASPSSLVVGERCGSSITTMSRSIYPPDEMYQQLVDNIKHHQMIIRCVSLLQKLLSRATSVLLFCNTVSICFQIMATAVLLQEDVEVIQTVKMLMSSTLYAYQVALFCLLGQKIINESDRLPRSAFSCGWPEADTHCWRLLVALCRRSSRALSLKVCGLYTLSRETLLQILNVSYSLFNFMYQTDKSAASRH
ncbi:odorant receptor 46a-like [Schistocerca gregaria]|uniref:odorant receptor 46a-like n=1 Tax=Schistocerca gregaria TaxID=7010 RepID=UPI00211EA082|nr:odorant receptor 46a-like [Schistocerca gregaria]